MVQVYSLVQLLKNSKIYAQDDVLGTINVHLHEGTGTDAIW